jgi:hypothetical protein
MSDRLSLRTAFFNLVGGRRQDSSETFRANGTFRTHSGEVLGFYGVTEASPPGPMGARARRLVLDVVQEELASRFDLSLGARLKHAVNVANDALRTEFSGHVQVGLTLLVSESDALYLLQVPPGQAYVLHDGTLHAVSAGLAEDPASFDRALGSSTDPYVCLFRDTIETGDLILLASSWVAEAMDPDDLRDAFAEEGPRRLTRTLFDISRRLDASDLTCVALQAQPEQDGATQHPSELPAGPAAPPRTVWEYVDDAVGSLGYVLNLAKDEFAPPSRPRQAPSGSAPVASHSEITGYSASSVTPAEDDEPVLEDIPPAQSALDFDWPRNYEHLTEELPTVGQGPDVAEQEPHEISELDEVNSFIRNTSELHRVSPPIQAFPDTTVAPERIYPAGPSRRQQPYRDGGFTRRNGRSGSRNRPSVARRRAGALSSIPPAMILWSVLGVGLLVLVVVLVTLVSGGGPNYTVNARSEAAKAIAAFHAGNTTDAATDLSAAWTQLRKARTHSDSKTDIQDAFSNVQNASDVLYYVYRPQAKGIDRFNAIRAHPTQLTTGTKQLFILDSRRRQIWAVDLNGHGTKKVVGEFGDANINHGTNQYTFTTPRLLTSFDNSLVALDDQFDVMVQDPLDNSTPLTVQKLPAPATSTRVTVATTWSGNLYIVDAKSAQVYRYVGTGYWYAPFTTFAEARLVSAVPALHHATGLAVANSSIYVALYDGKILKFSLDKSSPDYDSATNFAVHGVPIRFAHATQLYARDGLNTMFLVNAPANKIVELDSSGKYIRTVIPAGLKHHLRAITISNDGKTIYFTSGRELYDIPVDPSS